MRKIPEYPQIDEIIKENKLSDDTLKAVVSQQTCVQNVLESEEELEKNILWFLKDVWIDNKLDENFQHHDIHSLLRGIEGEGKLNPEELQTFKYFVNQHEYVTTRSYEEQNNLELLEHVFQWYKDLGLIPQQNFSVESGIIDILNQWEKGIQYFVEHFRGIEIPELWIESAIIAKFLQAGEKSIQIFFEKGVDSWLYDDNTLLYEGFSKEVFDGIEYESKFLFLKLLAEKYLDGSFTGKEETLDEFLKKIFDKDIFEEEIDLEECEIINLKDYCEWKLEEDFWIHRQFADSFLEWLISIQPLEEILKNLNINIHI